MYLKKIIWTKESKKLTNQTKKKYEKYDEVKTNAFRI